MRHWCWLLGLRPGLVVRVRVVLAAAGSPRLGVLRGGLSFCEQIIHHHHVQSRMFGGILARLPLCWIASTLLYLDTRVRTITDLTQFF